MMFRNGVIADGYTVKTAMSTTQVLFVCAVALITCSASAQDNWIGFRNTGSSIVSADIPTHWSPQDGIAWKSDIPGYGQSSPVAWKNQIYVTSSDGPFQEECQVHALDLHSGEKLWTSHINTTTKVENYFRNSRAAPTCCVDETAVYSFFASGDLTAMKHDGSVLWTLPILEKYGEVKNERGVASSPAQNEELIFILIDHDGPSYLLAVNKSDGHVAWKTDRGVRIPSWSSPVVANCNGREIVVTSSSDCVDAYNATSGKELWHLGGLQGNHIPSATVVGDEVFTGSTTMFHGATDENATAKSNCCLKLIMTDGNPDYQLKWSAQRANSYYSTPLAFAGYVYYVNNVGVLFCINQEDGKQLFAKRIGNPCWASAIGVIQSSGEKFVYLFTKNGFTTVLRAGVEYDEVARNQLFDAESMSEASLAAAQQRKANKVPNDQAVPKSGPEKVFANMPARELHQMFSYGDPLVYGVAVAGDKLLIRTGQQLYCICKTDLVQASAKKQ